MDADDVDADYPAVMAARERLWRIYGDAWGWPPETLTFDQDRDDLARHARETAAHESFLYGVFDETEAGFFGCVYVDPPASEAEDAVVVLVGRGGDGRHRARARARLVRADVDRGDVEAAQRTLRRLGRLAARARLTARRGRRWAGLVQSRVQRPGCPRWEPARPPAPPGSPPGTARRTRSGGGSRVCAPGRHREDRRRSIRTRGCRGADDATRSPTVAPRHGSAAAAGGPDRGASTIAVGLPGRTPPPRASPARSPRCVATRRWR